MLGLLRPAQYHTISIINPSHHSILPRKVEEWTAHINNPTQSPYSISSINLPTAHSSGILHNTAGNHNDILRLLTQLFDDEIHHLTERGIFILEQLRDAEEEGCGFVLGEFLAGEEQEGDFGEQDAAFAGGDGGGVEDARCALPLV